MFANRLPSLADSAQKFDLTLYNPNPHAKRQASTQQATLPKRVSFETTQNRQLEFAKSSPVSRLHSDSSQSLSEPSSNQPAKLLSVSFAAGDTKPLGSEGFSAFVSRLDETICTLRESFYFMVQMAQSQPDSDTPMETASADSRNNRVLHQKQTEALLAQFLEKVANDPEIMSQFSKASSFDSFDQSRIANSLANVHLPNFLADFSRANNYQVSSEQYHLLRDEVTEFVQSIFLTKKGVSSAGREANEAIDQSAMLQKKFATQQTETPSLLSRLVSTKTDLKPSLREASKQVNAMVTNIGGAIHLLHHNPILRNFSSPSNGLPKPTIAIDNLEPVKEKLIDQSESLRRTVGTFDYENSLESFTESMRAEINSVLQEIDEE